MAMRKIVSLCCALIFLSLFAANTVLSQNVYENEKRGSSSQSEEGGTYTVYREPSPPPRIQTSDEPPKTDPAVLRKLDDISSAIKDLKSDLSKIKEELNVIRARVTR
jgi:hypothetical protein